MGKNALQIPFLGKGVKYYTPDFWKNTKNKPAQVESTHAEVRAERSFTLLEDVNCPAVLAEQCFVTSAEDVAQFGSEEGCRKTARVYYEAICHYFGTEPLAEALANQNAN